MKCKRDFQRHAYAFMNTFIKYPKITRKEYPIFNGLFLKEYYYLKKITKNGMSYINYDDSIFETDKKIVLLTEVPLDSDLENILPNVIEFKEDHIYFAYTNILHKLIFDSFFKKGDFWKKYEPVELLPFCNFLDQEQVYAKTDVKKLSPNIYGMNIKRFQNYTSSKYIGFISRKEFVFNLRHKFVSFLYDNKVKNRGKTIINDKLFYRFVDSFSDLEKLSIKTDSIISLQRELLLSCLEKNLISKTEFDNLILSKEDFVMYPHGINF